MKQTQSAERGRLKNKRYITEGNNNVYQVDADVSAKYRGGGVGEGVQ